MGHEKREGRAKSAPASPPPSESTRPLASTKPTPRAKLAKPAEKLLGEAEAVLARGGGGKFRAMREAQKRDCEQLLATLRLGRQWYDQPRRRPAAGRRARVAHLLLVLASPRAQPHQAGGPPRPEGHQAGLEDAPKNVPTKPNAPGTPAPGTPAPGTPSQ